MDDEPACDRCASAARAQAAERRPAPRPPAEAKRTVTTTTHTSGVSPEEASEIKATVDQGKIRCARCHEILTRQGFQAMGLWFHPGCFLCTQCNGSISVDGYVNIDGRPFHQHCADRYRPAVPATADEACSVCNKAMHGRWLVINGQKYHNDCFVCQRYAAILTLPN